MAIKHIEFMKLTQGNKSLNEYLQAFNNLARYAPEFMYIDAKKIASFKRGLSPKLMKSMGNNKCTTFNEFISDALTQENNDNIYAASKSHKRNYEAGASQSKAYVVAKTQYHSPAANIQYCPHQRRIRLRLAFARGTWFLCQRILLGRAVPMFHQLIGHARIATSLVIGLRIVHILPSRHLREMSVRGVFTIPL
jgi:hypothetical protein